MPPTSLKSVPATTGPGVGLVRSDPPPKGHAGGSIRLIAALVPDVEAEPGVWFQVATWTAKSSASSAKKKLKAEFPSIAWEARSIAGGGSGLWARAEP